MTTITIPIDVAEAASEALGNFVSDHGWSDSDMQAMDNLDSYIARHKAIRALRAEAEVQTMRNIRQVDNTMEQRLVAENAALRVAIAEIGDILEELERSKEPRP